MPVIVKECDITRFKGDAIINSIGNPKEELGALCQKILEKAKDDSLLEFVYRSNRNIGTIEITDAGELLCSKIIHVVTPFKGNEINEDNDILVRTYKNIIRIARERGYKKIAVPLIGSGANGYTKSESYSAIMKASEDILDEEEKMNKDIIHITIMPYIRKKERVENDGREKNNRNQRAGRVKFIPQGEDLSVLKVNETPIMKSIIKKTKIESFDNNLYDFVIPNKKNDFTTEEIKENTIKILKSMSVIKEEEILCYKFKKYEYSYDFVLDYLFQKGLDDKILSYQGLGRQRKYNIKNSKRMMKDDVFRIAFSCGMSFTETLQFMLISDHSFNPYSDYDMFFLNYLLGKYGKVKNLIELDQFAAKEGIEKPFAFCVI